MLPHLGVSRQWHKTTKRIVVCCGFVCLSFLAIVGFDLLPKTQAAEKTLPDHQVSAAPAKIKPKLVPSYGKLPLRFEANQGQVRGTVKFLARGRGYKLFLTGSEAVLALRKQGAIGQMHGKLLTQTRPDSLEAFSRFLRRDEGIFEREPAALGSAPRLNSETDPPAVLRLQLVGANSQPSITGMDELPGKSNYFLGNDPKKWRTNVPTYAKVKYTDVYPGVDLVYYGAQTGQLEYDFVVAPGADPNKIKMSFAGADGMQVDVVSGDLVLKVGEEELRFHKPKVYQPTEETAYNGSTRGRKVLSALGQPNPKPQNPSPNALSGTFMLTGNNEVSFRVSRYDPRRALVIDPTLVYSTYLGGSGMDAASGVAVDAAGNAFVTGYTFSPNFPITAGSYDAGCGTDGGCNIGTNDAFIAKFNASGSALLFSTYLGGSLDDVGGPIGIDALGNVYVVGSTASSDFPTINAAQSVFAGGGMDAFVAKLNATGNALLYSTYLGGSGNEDQRAIAVDPSGDAYVTGSTTSANFPVANPIQVANAGGADGYITKLNNAGQILYSTYFGGIGDEAINGVALSAAGEAYITGSTTSTIYFPATPGALVTGVVGGAFIAKLNAGGSAIIYSTNIGGDDLYSSGSGIVIDASGDAFVTGSTYSSSFPTTPSAYQTVLRGYSDAFALKLNPSGTALIYSTLLGGSGNEEAQNGLVNGGFGSIQVDATGNVYIAGNTDSTDFPLLSPLQSTNNEGCDWIKIRGCGDVFFTVLNASGTGLLFSTYLGGTGFDGVEGFNALALDSSGNAYIAGMTQSGDFPIINAFQPVLGGYDMDGFVLKLATNIASPAPAVQLSTTSLSFPSQTVNVTSATQPVTLTNTGNVALTISQITPSGDFGETNNCPASLAANANCTISVTFTPTATGTRTGTITINDDAADSPQTVNLTGTGTSGSSGTPTVTLSTPSLTFAGQTESTTSDPHSVMITNTGTANLTISTAASGGTNASDFSKSNDTCTGATVAPASTCTISVTFNPTATGGRVGTLLISDNASDSPQSVTLSGTGTAMPVIFIPGTMGSELVDEGKVPVDLWVDSFLPLSYGLLTLYAADNPTPGIRATDVIRSVPAQEIYQPFIDFLTHQKDSLGNTLYPLYELNGNPGNLTMAGCDYINQQANFPKLFLFPYDWRQSNAVSAAELRDYVGCIQAFYPGTKVNIVAHSMGGLVARWYILHNPGNPVNELVSIATPWLGAPSTISCLATGDCVDEWLVRIIDTQTFKYISGSLTGVHQLLPSEAYFDLGGSPPLGEVGWDWNTDGHPDQKYTYGQYLDALNQHFGFDAEGRQEFYPGTATDAFHNNTTALGAMDGWPNDLSGVKNYQLYGIQSKEKTIGQVFAVNQAGCVSLTGSKHCVNSLYFQPVFTCGDKTVPVVSATVSNSGCRNSFPQDTNRILFQPALGSSDDTVEHLGLLQNSQVENAVSILLSQPLSTPMTSTQVSTQRRLVDSAAPSFQPANYLTIVGANSVVVSDTLGNSTAVITGILQGTVPDVSTYALGNGVMALILPTGNEYTVTFQTTATPLNIILNIGTPDLTTEAIRYVDVNQPTGLNSKLHFLPGSVDPLTVDTNNDGSFSTTINPSSDVIGNAAQDTTPPVVSFSATVAGAITTLAAAATDPGSGVKDLFYSTDGATFQAYAGALQLDASKTPVVYAFADDNVLNRSSVMTFTLPRPAVSLQAGSLSFPSTLVGSPSNAQTLTVSNSGAAPLVVSGVSVTGDFSQSNNCPASPSAIPISGNCTISVTFKPTAGGARTGSIALSDNAPGSPHSVTLSGTGQDFTLASASGSSTTAKVAPGATATYTLSASGLGGFNQNVTFTCTGAPSEATCAVSPNPGTVGSSATNVTVTVSTTAPSTVAPRCRPLPPISPLLPGLRSLWMFALALVAMVWAFLRRNQIGLKRWHSTTLLIASGLLLALALGGCGGGGGGGGGGPTPNPGTPAGTYSLTVTGATGSGSSALSHSVTLTLNVS